MLVNLIWLYLDQLWRVVLIMCQGTPEQRIRRLEAVTPMSERVDCPLYTQEGAHLPLCLWQPVASQFFLRCLCWKTGGFLFSPWQWDIGHFCKPPTPSSWPVIRKVVPPWASSWYTDAPSALDSEDAHVLFAAAHPNSRPWISTYL